MNRMTENPTGPIQAKNLEQRKNITSQVCLMAGRRDKGMRVQGFDINRM